MSKIASGSESADLASQSEVDMKHTVAENGKTAVMLDMTSTKLLKPIAVLTMQEQLSIQRMISLTRHWAFSDVSFDKHEF